MTVTINERLTAKHWTGAAYVPAAWGIGPRVVTSITIHWWGNPVGQTYEGILDWFCNPQSSVGTSAHYVVSAGQAACIVSPWDAAWHAGSAYGNVHSIGIECNPRCSAGDYQTIAEVVANIRAMYGNIPLFAHNHWTSTTCPGDYRLAEIDALAATITGKSTTVTPIPLEDTLSAKDVNAITAAILKEGKETRDYVAALLLKGWSLGGVKHPGIGMVVEENQRRINRVTKDALTPTQIWGYKNVGDTKDMHQVLQDAAAPATVELDTAGVQSIAAQLETQLGTGIVAKIAEQWNK